MLKYNIEKEGHKVKQEYTVESIIEYCKEYKLNEVLLEYIYCNSKQKFGSVFDDEYGIPETFALQYVEDEDDNTIKRMKQFNSPFYPFVLCVIETGQEGLDLHFYCDKMFHSDLPSNASAFIQREGRIDRNCSLVIGRRLSQVKDVSNGGETNFDDMFVSAYKYFEELDKQKLIDNAYKAGLFPEWYIPPIDDCSPYIYRIMDGTMLSGKAEKNEMMLFARDNYCNFLTDEDKEKLCSFLSKTSE